MMNNIIDFTDPNKKIYELLGTKADKYIPQGKLGFSVEPCLPNTPFALLGLAEMVGTNIKDHENYGNYIHTNGSIVCHMPRMWYRIGHVDSPRYTTYGANAIDTLPLTAFADEAAANLSGYALHRSFIDGGEVKNGFFIDKYKASKSQTDTNLAVSVKNGVPISLTTDTNYTRSQGMTGCIGQLLDAVTLSRARGEGWNATTAFMRAWLLLTSIAQAQATTNTTDCAWYDATGVKNYPKGCNNGSLADANDATVIYTTAGDAGSAGKPKTGSANNLAKTTHNGSLNGVVDVNGGMWEADIGITNYGTSATASAQILDDSIYVLKHSVAIKNLTGDWDTENSIWGDAANLANKYDIVTAPLPIGSTAGAWVYWGNGTNAVLDNANNGQGRDLCGVFPKNQNSVLSSGGSNLFGNDGIYKDNKQNMFLLSCGAWLDGGNAGPSARSFSVYRTYSSYYTGFRAGAYV